MNEEMSFRNIVICSDGTGNTFDESVSNVTRLIKHIELDNAQVALYDQGIGTNSQRLRAVKSYRQSIGCPGALLELDGPPSDCVSLVLGLAFGYGLKENVREIYQKLSQLYRDPSDRIFLFGFSRGAFTVRALAGLIYRCGLPCKEVEDFNACFEEAWKLYQPHLKDDPPSRAVRAAVKTFRNKYCRQEDLEILFLGIWDTVKSYGGLNPISLPHLRHNPIVKNVRHALALDEKRSWFAATTWGQLDLDKEGAGTRLEEADAEKYKAQGIKEVWFRGCHSDVGGGDKEELTANIPLRWMLAEAVQWCLRPNAQGEALLATPDPVEAPPIHESDNRVWRALALLPRLEIDNSGKWPVKKWRIGHTGHRKPSMLLRNKTVYFHESVCREYSTLYEATIRQIENPKREATTRNDVASQNEWAMSGSLSKGEHG
jgi:uncharacterized protein (DUF2235 family)